MTFKQYMVEGYIQLPDELRLQATRIAKLIKKAYADQYFREELYKNIPQLVTQFEYKNKNISVVVHYAPPKKFPYRRASVSGLRDLTQSEPIIIKFFYKTTNSLDREDIEKMCIHELTHIVDKGLPGDPIQSSSHKTYHQYLSSRTEVEARINEYLFIIRQVAKNPDNINSLYIDLRSLLNNPKALLHNFIYQIFPYGDKSANNTLVNNFLQNKKFIRKLSNAVYHEMMQIKDKYSKRAP